MSPFPALTIRSHDERFLASFPGWNGPEEFDDAAYNRAAVEVLRTGIPTDHTGAIFVYAPVYAYFVAGCYALGGIRLLAVAIPQAILAALSCGFLASATYHVARQFKFAAMLLTASLFLINVRLAMYVGYVSPTLLLVFFFSVATWAASQAFSTARRIVLVASLILATGTQAGFFFVAFAVVVWLVIRFARKRIKADLIAACVILIFAGGKNFLPTLLEHNTPRNVSEIGRAVLWEANNPYYETMGLFSLWERRPGNPWTGWKMSPDEEQRHACYLERAGHRTIRAALLWIRENPLQYTKLSFVRLWTTLGPFTGMMSPRNRFISFFIWLLTFPVGAYGWWLCRRAQLSGFATAVAISIILSSTLVIVEWYLRYRFPLEMLLTMYAGVGYAYLIMAKQRPDAAGWIKTGSESLPE
jgi:hypothetical protein